MAYISENERYGAVAVQGLEQEQVYFSIDLDQTIHDQLVYQSPIGSLLRVYQDNWPTHPPSNYLNLLFFLMTEKHNMTSFWLPYLNILPSDYSHLPVNSVSAMQELVHLPIHSEIDRYNTSLHQRYYHLNRTVFSFFTQHFHEQHFTLDNYIWANYVLDSRSIWVDGKRHLIPVLDMVNCCGDT